MLLSPVSLALQALLRINLDLGVSSSQLSLSEQYPRKT